MTIPDRDDRAQLLLVAGLVIAVLFVGLALLVNTAIYTENVATRGSDAGTEALEYQGAVVTTVGGFVDAENADEESDARDNIENGDGIAEIEAALDDQFLRRGGSTELDHVAQTPGFLIFQNESRTFTDSDGVQNHTLAEDVDATRGFVLEVESAVETGDPYNEAFHVALDIDGGGEHRYYVYEDDSSSDIVVAVGDEADTDPEAVCSLEPTGEPVSVDLTGKVLTSGTDRADCHDLEWPVGETYNIDYTYGDRAEGTYHLTVDADENDIVANIIGLLSDPEQPYAFEAVYDVTVEVRYDSVTISYETDVRIAPGEPDA